MASRVEDLLIRMGQAGQIRGQVTDEAMKGLLQQVRQTSDKADICEAGVAWHVSHRPSGSS